MDNKLFIGSKSGFGLDQDDMYHNILNEKLMEELFEVKKAKFSEKLVNTIKVYLY